MYIHDSRFGKLISTCGLLLFIIENAMILRSDINISLENCRKTMQVINFIRLISFKPKSSRTLVFVSGEKLQQYNSQDLMQTKCRILD